MMNKRTKRGRPPRGRAAADKLITIRVTGAEREKLNDQARARGLSVSAMLLAGAGGLTKIIPRN